MSGINNDALKNLLSVEMSMTIKNPLTDEGLGSYTITNLGVNSVDFSRIQNYLLHHFRLHII